jgi:hypothetical protein
MATTLSAQVLKTGDVLETAAGETRVAQNEALQSLAGRLKMHDPLLRQIALRVGINGSVLGDTIYGYLRNEDTYQLQIGFNSLRERQRQRKVKYARVAAISAETQVLHQEALVARYEALAGYLFTAPRQAACRRLDTLLEKEHRILREMLTTGVLDVKVSKVLGTEEDRNRNRATMQQLDNTLALEKSRLQQFVGEFSSIDRSDLVSAADIRANIAALRAQEPSATHPLIAQKQAEFQLENAGLNYITAQNRQILNNFSVGYQDPLYLERPKRFNTFNNFNVRVGLTVPLPSNNRYKRADALLDLREAQNDMTWVREEVANDLAIQLVQLDNLLRQHDLLQTQMEESLIRKMLDNQTLRGQLTPLEIVELEIAQQKLTVSQASILAEIATEYVRLLEVSGAAAQNPQINYLSSKR